MKFPPTSTWATHLLALLAGVGIFHAVRSPGPAGKVSGLVKAAESPAPRNPAEAEVMRRLGDIRGDSQPQPEKSTETPPEPEPVKTRAQIRLEMRREYEREWPEELAALLKRAKDFEYVADLSVPLTTALIGDGDDDTAIAIFLEWHRRDPLAAFEELARRPGWTTTVLWNDAVMTHLTPEELVAQAGARHRSADFREKIVSELGEYLVDTDNLRALSSCYGKLDPVAADGLVTAFAEHNWVPRDAAAAQAFMSHGMDESCRKALIEKLANVSLSDASREWSDGIAAPLFREVLGDAKFTYLRECAQLRAKQPIGGCCGGGWAEVNLSDLDLAAKSLGSESPDADTYDKVAGRMLSHDKDYAELFAAGRISGDQVLDEVMAAIPDGARHEKGLRRAVYRGLAPWNPKEAVAWATGHLTEEDIQSVSADFTPFHFSEDTRALRMLELMEALPSMAVDGKHLGGLPCGLYNGLKVWRVLDPEAAGAAMSRSPEAETVAKKLEVEPGDKPKEEEGHVLPPMIDEETPSTPSEE